MGSASSKFRKHLQNGDEVAALHLYNNSADLRKGMDPSSSYGDSHQHETPLHYAARHGMKSLLRIFLHDHGGNPNKTNNKRETALHCVCMEKNSEFYSVKKRRAECLTLILQWRGTTLQDGEVEKVDLGAQDEKNNTALHYAAASGLRGCAELLVQSGCPLFVENIDQETPCDSAEKSGHGEIALYLESKMVFSNDGIIETSSEELLSNSYNERAVTSSEELLSNSYNEILQDYSGLRAQDLQEAKDQLLVETADMLSVPLFTAEALLRNHEWSREMLLEAWMSDPFACCEKCGVTPPPSLYMDKPSTEDLPLLTTSQSESITSDCMCEICTCSFLSSDGPVHMSCEHQFCRTCWKTYLNLKIQEGEAHHITCPAYGCSRLVPVDIIESVVSRQMARKYLQFDIQAFVESNPTIKWCPFPGCGNAVRLPDLEGPASPNILVTPSIPVDTSRAVDCGNGHYFCWECLGESHEPCSCGNWKTWHEKISEIKPEQLSCTEVETETAANFLWLVTNSKACPNCKSPIQKNEGCNHMKCTKCKHDFCWVCLEPWKRHNSSTGGYFKCNRYEVVKKVEEDTANAVSDAEAKNSRMQELNRFVHYYSRFKNHEHSYKLEEPLLHTAKDKMMKLAEAVTDIATANEETRFVEEAVHQLLKARRVLKCSYVYGYYLDGPGYKKIVFEFMQTELEECTEILSQMVNRLYLRTPRRKIIEQATIVQRKRHEFISAIAKGLVPPETPPSLRKKKRRKYSLDMEDEELRKAIIASIQEVDPANPWIKDASGRHTNVMAVLDWPGYDSDDSDSETLPPTSFGKCLRPDCDRPRAKNPRTGAAHDHCSLRCLRLDQLDKLEQKEKKPDPPEVVLDEHMDLLRALEMSRLQYLRDSGVLNSNESQVDDRSSHRSDDDAQQSPRIPHSSSPTVLSPPPPGRSRAKAMTPMEKLDLELQRVLEISSIKPEDMDPDLKLAMEISLKDSKGSGSPASDRCPHHSRKSSNSRFNFEDTTSSVVAQVPNKSVEDLIHMEQLPKLAIEDMAGPKDDPLEELGAYGGQGAQAVPLLCAGSSGLSAGASCPNPQSHLLLSGGPQAVPQVSRSSSKAMSAHSKAMLESNVAFPASQSELPVKDQAMPSHDDTAATLPERKVGSRLSDSSFGIIKDLDVTNIHAGDVDKTKEFLAKDISLFPKQKESKGGRADGEVRKDKNEDSVQFTCQFPQQWITDSCDAGTERALLGQETKVTLDFSTSDLSFIDAESPEAVKMDSVFTEGSKSESGVLWSGRMAVDADSPELRAEQSSVQPERLDSQTDMGSHSDCNIDKAKLLQMTEDLLIMTAALPSFDWDEGGQSEEDSLASRHGHAEASTITQRASMAESEPSEVEEDSDSRDCVDPSRAPVRSDIQRVRNPFVPTRASDPNDLEHSNVTSQDDLDPSEVTDPNELALSSHSFYV
ncbi:ankyrin repeat and IBR domain-containing protein 1-like [Liolophura sinensis]|uniref:ankyrin repeat and IBR domain-containing protein 1-like n=1 Tax=Liolophura sinensis TaxID=3198878 RepID=UPI003158F423